METGVQKEDKKILFETEVGSRMWKMEHEGSDTDLFVAYQAPSHDILIGKAHGNSHFSKGEVVDRSSHEIGVVCKQLLKGNVNFLWGVFSPKVNEVDDVNLLDSLRVVAKQNLSKQCYNSIHGLSIANYQKYIVKRNEPEEQILKRCRIIVRTLNFGVNLLENGNFKFKPIGNILESEVLPAIEALDEAYKHSFLSEQPEHVDEMEEWLFMLRMDNLREYYYSML